ncbi:calcium-binding protein [Sulfitobacter sp. F26169L]|uniref:calcium-binding protein n=1 Tax=Sulfitobacter sp. F26169L TaxID=2996015 RepID=UPI002260AE3A|nr:calcium-binding protein [Sulfitobacter sp. F26169L]MCX7565121.1 calcium-binding protein [Sulfitobacter sp. F26169L]
MPIIFNEETNGYEGENFSTQTLAGFDFSVFGGAITNSGAIAGTLSANSDAGIEVSNVLGGEITKVAGTPFAVSLLGNGGRNFSNDGDIFGDARFGNGWDSFFNSGLIEGKLILGSGNDLLVNQIIPGIDGGPVTVGTITGGVFMGDGNDTVLNTGILNDVFLGAGNDTYSVGGTFDNGLFAVGVAGNIHGGDGDDEITGGDADDRFFGGADNDTIEGRAGRDQLFGQSGDDSLFGGQGNDKIFGGDGDDFIDGGSQNDVLYGSSGNDVIYAGQGNDKLMGGIGDDDLFGGSGNDRLVGNAGSDTLEGGAGHDTMFGGTGADVFVFSGYSGRDDIRDFSEGDRIDIYGPGWGSISYADLIANTSFTGDHAVIDLSALFNGTTDGTIIDRGSILTVRNVTAGDLDEDAFNLINDFYEIG